MTQNAGISFHNKTCCVQVADAVVALVQVQHQSGGEREKMEVLQAQLLEEQRRSQQLEETLKLQVQQNSFQISVKQVERC